MSDPAAPRQRVRRWVLAAGLLAAVVATLGRPLQVFVAPDPAVQWESRHDVRTFEDLGRWPAADGQFENEGFVACASGALTESGWCLPAGAVGSLSYTLPELAGARGLLLRLFFFRRDAAAESRLTVWRQGEPEPRLSFEGVYFADARLDLSVALEGSGGPVVLRFEGRNPTDHADVVLQHLEVRAFAEPIPAVPSVLTMALVWFLLGCCALPLVSWRRWLPLWAIITVGFALRYYALTQVLYLPLDYDAETFAALSRQLTLFSEQGFFSGRLGNREPLFPLVLKGWLWVLGDAETHVRLASLAASLLVIVQTVRLGSRLFSRPLGLLGGLLVAGCLPLVRESVRGLRLEWEILLVLLFLEVAFVASSRSLWRRAVLAGALAGVLTLLRTSYLVNLAPLLLVMGWPWQGRRLWAAGLALLVMLAVQLPHRVNGYRAHGSWTWDNNARWWANLEFAGRPGWPSKPEVWLETGGQSRHEAPMTTFDYLFRLHSVPEVAVGSARGLWKLLRHMEVVAFHRGVARLTGFRLDGVDIVFQIAGIAGLLLACFRPEFRWLTLAFCFLMAHLLFLYDRGLVEPWRHTYQAFPLVLFGVLLLLAQVNTALRRRAAPS